MESLQDALPFALLARWPLARQGAPCHKPQFVCTYSDIALHLGLLASFGAPSLHLQLLGEDPVLALSRTMLPAHNLSPGRPGSRSPFRPPPDRLFAPPAASDPSSPSSTQRDHGPAAAAAALPRSLAGLLTQLGFLVDRPGPVPEDSEAIPGPRRARGAQPASGVGRGVTGNLRGLDDSDVPDEV